MLNTNIESVWPEHTNHFVVSGKSGAGTSDLDIKCKSPGFERRRDRDKSAERLGGIRLCYREKCIVL